MKILNTIHEDYHVHSLNYSDGMNTIDEIVQYAGKIWMKKIVISDHSQAVIDADKCGIGCRRWMTKRRSNIHNDVEVIFGVEGDLLNKEGDCCFAIQGKESDFSILSCHPECYEWDLKNITQAYINAIHRYHDKIKFIGHICLKTSSQYLDIEAVAKVLNQYQIPIEIDCGYIVRGHTDLEKLKKILPLIEAGVYINSDAHVLNELNSRQAGFDFLKEQGFISS